MFDNFDFSILENKEFKEDAVREELITPLLKRLGYSVSGQNKIIRSKSLVHPFVSIGTSKRKINIIPDYLLTVDNQVSWILDAKKPSELITEGKNVEQAYCYAMHKDVRVNLYGLCNGKQLVVFQISTQDPILNIALSEIDKHWKEVEEVLSPQHIKNPFLKFIRPDYGIHLLKGGLKINDRLYLKNLSIKAISKIEDTKYSISIDINENDMLLHCSIDFNLDLFEQLTSQMEDDLSTFTKERIKYQPFMVLFGERRHTTDAFVKIGKNIFDNGEEIYLPFEALEFFK